MADKAPCRHYKELFTGQWGSHSSGRCDAPIPNSATSNRNGSISPDLGQCHGCPCHEPEPAKDETEQKPLHPLLVEYLDRHPPEERAAKEALLREWEALPKYRVVHKPDGSGHLRITFDDDKAPDTQRTEPPTTCRWWRDEYGNWCCACSDTMPDFTPWPSTDPNGAHCPKCGKVIATKVHDKP